MLRASLKRKRIDDMKHNERARVAPLDFLNILFVHRKKGNAHTTRTPPGLVFGSLARCGRPFLGSLARSARFEPSACSSWRGAKAPLAAPERIRSKNERLSAQSFTRRYEMVRDAVTVQ